MRPLQCISTGELSSFRKPNSLCHSASVILLHIVYIYPDLHICSYRAAVDEGHRSLTHRALLLSDYLLTVPPVFHVHCKKKNVLREILNGHAPTIISQPRPIHNSITQITPAIIQPDLVLMNERKIQYQFPISLSQSGLCITLPLLADRVFFSSDPQ